MLPNVLLLSLSPKDLLCYTAQPEPAASDPNCSHILQSDIKETVENEFATVFFKEMLLLQREPMVSESKAATTYLLYYWILWRFYEEYFNQFRWSKIGIWILKYRCPSKGSQSSPQMSIEIYISSLKVKIPGHCHSWWYLYQHIFIHLNTCHWWISTRIRYHSLQEKFRNFRTYRDIGNIDDIWAQQTLFSKIQEHFGVIILLEQKVGTVIFEASLDI